MVRNVLLSHPAVRWARVFGRNAPLVGRIVAAEVVTDGTVDRGRPDEVGRDAGCPSTAVPRRIRLLDEIPMKETLKSDV